MSMSDGLSKEEAGLAVPPAESGVGRRGAAGTTPGFSQLPVIFFAVLVVMWLAGVLAMRSSAGHTAEEQFAYAAYAFPALAAVAAGMNVYRKSEHFWFWVSGGLVFFGFVMSLAANRVLGETLRQIIFIAGGLAFVVALITYSVVSTRRNWSERIDFWVAIAAFILVVGQGTLVTGINLKKSQVPVGEPHIYVCERLASSATAERLSCVQEQDKSHDRRQ